MSTIPQYSAINAPFVDKETGLLSFAGSVFLRELWLRSGGTMPVDYVSEARWVNRPPAPYQATSGDRQAIGAVAAFHRQPDQYRLPLNDVQVVVSGRMLSM